MTGVDIVSVFLPMEPWWRLGRIRTTVPVIYFPNVVTSECINIHQARRLTYPINHFQRSVRLDGHVLAVILMAKPEKGLELISATRADGVLVFPPMEPWWRSARRTTTDQPVI